MPGNGAYCSIYGCNISRKNSKLAIFKIPAGNGEYESKWRDKLIHVVTKDRVVDSSLKKQIESRKLFICEKHFNEEDILRRKYNNFKSYRFYQVCDIDYFVMSCNFIFDYL